MKGIQIKKILALALAASMILSDASVPVFANQETQIVTQAVESTATTEATEKTQTTEVAQTTETTEKTEVVVQTEPELSLMDRLMTTKTLEELHNLVMAQTEEMQALSLGEVSAVKTQTQTLYAKIDTPSEAEQGYYDRVMEVLTQLLGENKPVKAATVVDGRVQGSVFAGGGEFQLDGNTTLRSRIEISSAVTVEIDLNGYVLTVSDRNQLASVYGKLVIKDSAPTRSNSNGTGGFITGSGNSGNYGGAICVEPSGELVIEGGTISGFKGDRGGAIHCAGTMYMSGGKITGCSANYGGAINSRGFFQMSGGTISGNSATNGGGIAVGDGQFFFTGGTITENTASTSGGGMYIWLSNWANDGHARLQVTIAGGTISKNKAADGGGITLIKGKFTMSGGTLSNNTATTDGGGIYIEEADGAVTASITGGEISKNTGAWGGGIHVARGVLTISGGAISENKGTSNGGGISFKNSTVNVSGGSISWNTATSGKGGGILVESGNLNLTGGTIGNNTAASGGGVYNQGTAAMGGDAVITANHSTGKGGGVYNVSTVTMTGGEISGNQAGDVNGTDAVDKLPTYTSQWGGGIYTSDSGARVTMDGGTITNNTAASGGGVGVWSGSTFVMNGGTISDNKAYGIGGPGNGGASYVNGSTFEFHGGIIENNWARRYGGAINLNDGGKMKLTGSKGECIIRNNSANNGGGISQEQGQCEIAITSDNIIVRNNTARDDNRTAEEHLRTDGCGGGFFIEKGKFEMSAGTVADNNAVLGGGVALRVQRIDGDIDVDITGGTISGNTAVESGGGIDIYGGYKEANAENRVTVDLLGGNITGNRTTAGTGGGIDIWTDATHTTGDMYIGKTGTTGPIITDNRASTNGGAIRMRSGQVYLRSGTISNNHAGQYGGGITVNGGDFEMSGGTIGGTAEGSANTAGDGGGGISLRVQEFASDITVNMTGGSIIGNRAVNTGGGMDIYANFERNDSKKNNVTVSLLGGTFENNTSTEGTGGGIDIDVAETNSTAVLNIGKAGTPGPQFINNAAATNGGSIRMHNGNIHLYSGSITKNTAKLNGGAISINGGNFTMTGGDLSENTVTEGYGGAIALSNGTVLISDGTVTKNTAYIHGGGVVVSNGEIIMTGGKVSDNLAQTGNGGGLYITSYGASRVSVKIFSGEISGNRAPNGSGGGLAVNGGTGDTVIFVQMGLNLQHVFAGNPRTLTPIPHDRDGKTGNEYLHEYCPVIKNNSSLVSGGGIFITGGSDTRLHIYCLEEASNSTVQDEDNTGVLSQFMMVEGGKVIISSSQTDENGEIDKETSGYGNTAVLSSVHVYAGELYLYGNMENPAFTDALTVDYRNPTDKFEDHRQSDKMIKLTYNENYRDANGNPEMTMKAYDIQKGSVVTIAELLFQHPGYTIKGWNTEPDGSGVSYTVGDEYLFIKKESDKSQYALEGNQQYQVDHLNLYAVWEVNLFMVEYHHGIPDGEPYSGNMDGQHIFTYDQYANLELNRFVYPGHVFQHWRYTDDEGNTVTLTDGQSVKNLTNVRGGTVHLWAVWADCSHSFAYTANGAVLTKTCTLCTKSASVTLQAENAVYDGNMHKYTVVYSDKTFFEPEIICSAAKFGKAEAPEIMYVDAGVYTISTNVAESHVQAALMYHIDKAQQKAPESLPTYDTPNAGNNYIVSIHQKPEELESGESGALIQYTLRYTKNNGASVDLGWKSNGNGSDVIFSLPEAFTIYSVYSRYPETDNYYASTEKIAMSSFFFEGGITVLITPTEGITYTVVKNANSMDILPSLEPGYYLTEGQFYVTVQEGNDSGYIAVNSATSGKIPADGENRFRITSPKKPNGEEVEIYLELGYASKMMTVDSKIAPNQVFGTVSGTEATISRDSAYTAYFEVSGYDDAVYSDVGLTFDHAVPAGTKLILLDKTNGTYWAYAVADADVTTVLLRDFTRMGGNDPFSPSGESWKLQVVVDFSQATSWYTGFLNTKLSVTKPDAVPEAENPGVTAKLQETAFALEKESVSETAQTLTYSFNGVKSAASRWNHRELALILRPTTAMPADAVIKVTHNGGSVGRRPVLIQTGDTTQAAYLIPLDGFAGDVTLALETADEKAGEYSLSTQLVAAHSIAEDAAANGTVLASLDEITFIVRENPVSIKVTERKDQHLFNVGSSIALNIQIQPDTLPLGYEVVIAQEQKLDGESRYSFAGVYYEATGTGANRTLRIAAPTTPGCYRIRFYIESPNGTNVVETIYYFIVE